MSSGIKKVPDNHFWYYHLLQLVVLGLPFKDLVTLSNITSPDERIGDIDCGPADILRFVSPERMKTNTFINRFLQSDKEKFIQT